jgi:hypothetical protein
MRRKGTSMRIGSCVGIVVAGVLAASSGSAEAYELFDGRIQIHGAMSQEVRALSDGYRIQSDNWYMSAMKTRLSVEIETEIFPDGIGPFDIVEGFARLEFSYDCIWQRACDPSHYFGDNAKFWPRQLSDGRTRGVTGVLPNPLKPVELEQPDHELKRITDFDPFSTLLDLGTPEDVEVAFAPILSAKFSSIYIKGSLSPTTLAMGPINPGYQIDSIGSLANIRVANEADLPLRPLLNTPCATKTSLKAGFIDDAMTIPAAAGSGCLYVPSPGLLTRIDEYDNPDANFTVNELKWDLGASQQETKFLREAYLDITMFEGRLQLRLGKQITRWGKTELFRSGTPDQLNPQDFAISNLPSFEESLIALWQARWIWSFYQVGPFEDVRLEGVVNLDHFEPNDLGDCGEPYTVFLVCAKQSGLLAHGFSGLGIAGERRPSKFWQHFGRDLEAGVRLEFRIGRFSVAITDFYGAEDFPTPDWYNPYSRNVDPATGRPRIWRGEGSCLDGTQADCLTAANAATLHPGNRQLWEAACKGTQHFNVPGTLGAILPLTSCVIGVLNNPDPVITTTVPAILAEQLANGDRCNANVSGFCIVLNGLLGKSTFTPSQLADWGVVPLHPGRNEPAGLPAPMATEGLGSYLSPQQQALLGCGPLYFTDCDLQGIDLFNVEASVFFQAFPQAEHAGNLLDGAIATRWIPGTGTVQLPGARSVFNYFDDPVGYRWNPNVDGCVVGLTNLDAWQPGLGTAIRNDLITNQGLSPADADQCDFDPGDHAGNGAGLDGYQVPVPDAMFPVHLQDFDQTGTLYTVDQIRAMFPTEMAILSTNVYRLLVNLGTAIQDPVDPITMRSTVCTLAEPLKCEFMAAFFETTAVQRPERKAGGNGRYGRRDMSWLSGSSLDLFYQRRNVFGISTDFAEDWSKTTWGVDFTWIEDAPYINNKADRGFSLEDTLNLTMSIDRPTFVNFLNANRTIFFNTQLFLRYIPRYKGDKTFNVPGPVSLLATFTAFTGFWQDRLMTFVTLIHEVQSNSGGQIVTMNYRFSESFSVTIGMSSFYGKPTEERVLARNPVTRFHTGDFEQRSNFWGLSALAKRDELFVSLRKTF